MRPRSDLPNIARIGALIGNPIRARFLGALMDGGERSAGELATLADAAPQSASAHLASLVAGGLLTMRPQGRHRLYRLRNEDVAAAIEVLCLTATGQEGPRGVADDLRTARRCYDHVAGRLGVLICGFTIARGYVVASGDGATVTEAGDHWLASLQLRPPPGLRRPLVRLCQDWTERRPHLAGWLGAALCSSLEKQDVLRRRADTRALSITPTGRTVLTRLFDLSAGCLRRAPEDGS